VVVVELDAVGVGAVPELGFVVVVAAAEGRVVVVVTVEVVVDETVAPG
jgi:hypothetical protein